jgi:outer membrane protein TolC
MVFAFSGNLVGANGNQWKHRGILLLVCCLSLGMVQGGPVSGTPAPAADLSLSNYLQLVLDRNEALMAQLLETEISRHKARGEYGIFEPNLMLSAEREQNKRLNNSFQQSEQGGLLFFHEINNNYDTAIEQLMPTGGKVRLGYTLSDLRNNITNSISLFNVANQSMTREYQTFLGMTLTQPLLKNAGPGVTMAAIRLAALDSDIAFQLYRRQLMLTVSQAEAAYWNLYFAQEQLRFFEESVALAESVLSDSRERLKAGRAAELDVLEAQSGLALRKTKQNEARQSFDDAVGKAMMLYAASPVEHGPTIRALDQPSQAKTSLSYSLSFQHAFESNPEYLAQQKRLDQERLRLGVARNQLLPELNLKGAFGYNGLGLTPGDSLNIVDSQEYPSWSLGVEMNIPLAGNIKGRHQLSAAELSIEEAVVNLNSIQTQIANALHMAISKSRTWQESIQSYQTVVDFNESLLKTQMARLSVGKIEPRRVLEVEADLFEARQSLADALGRYQRTLLELELADGSILKQRNLELTREGLRRRTLSRLKNGSVPLDAFPPTLNAPATTVN